MNSIDCGVHAIAISLLFNIKPDIVKYNRSVMRQHLYKLLNHYYIEHFPVENMFLDNLAILRGEFRKILTMNNHYKCKIRKINEKLLVQIKIELLKKNMFNAGYISSEKSQLYSKKFIQSQINDKYYTKNRAKILLKKRKL